MQIPGFILHTSFLVALQSGQPRVYRALVQYFFFFFLQARQNTLSHSKSCVSTILLAQSHVVLWKKYFAGQREQFTGQAACLVQGSDHGSWADPVCMSLRARWGIWFHPQKQWGRGGGGVLSLRERNKWGFAQDQVQAHTQERAPEAGRP